MRILLADDNVDMQYLLTALFHASDHDVTVVSSGSELLRIIVEQGPGAFDVVVTDNDMPGGPSGMEVLRTLKKDERFEHVPIVVHTGARHLKEEVHQLGGIYAEKNANHRSLLEAIGLTTTVLHYRLHP